MNVLKKLTLFVYLFSSVVINIYATDRSRSTNTLISEVESVIISAQANILHKKSAEKDYWYYGAYLGVQYTSEYYLFLKWMDKKNSLLDETILKNMLLKQQQSGGHWVPIEDANQNSGDLGASIVNYWALKALGVDINSGPMKRARAFIVKNGGLDKAPVKCKMFLALFNNYEWDKLPKIPLGLFGNYLPVSADQFAQWISPHLRPMAYLRKYKINKHLGGMFSLKELFKVKRVVNNRQTPYRSFELTGAKTIIKQIVNKQGPKGSWGGYTSSITFSIAALEHFKASQGDRHYGKSISKVIAKAFAFVEQSYFNSGEISYRGVVNDGRFWDTALAVQALIESGYPAIELAASGDYLLKNRNDNGGFAFGYDFWSYPDNDDTAEQLLALAAIGGFDQELKTSIDWMINMQNDDGGWAAFDKNNTGNLILKLAAKDFADSADLFDESSPDVTGHVLEALATQGFDKTNSKVVQKAIHYLKKEVSNFPAWMGRWGVNYIYGTSGALIGLLRVQEDPKQAYIQKALNWLKSRQNNDGGFGESTKSYQDRKYAGRGVSTPTQTAWALMALIEAGQYKTDVVKKGIKYLLEQFQTYGEWVDASMVATGHPQVAYMSYPVYPAAFPFMALSRYLLASH